MDGAVDATSPEAFIASHLPEGPEREALLDIVRLGLKFRAQHVGRKPGVIAQLVQECASRGGPPYTFERLLEELELEAARRALHGEHASMIEKVDRIWQLATVHLPRRGPVQIAFGTLRNHLTRAKKNLEAANHGIR